MATQAWLIFTSQERTDAMLLNANSVGHINPRVIDNTMANNLGEGTLVGKYVCPARLLNDPDYTEFYEFCGELPIRTMDSDTLFLPDPEV